MTCDDQLEPSQPSDRHAIGPAGKLQKSALVFDAQFVNDRPNSCKTRYQPDTLHISRKKTATYQKWLMVSDWAVKPPSYSVAFCSSSKSKLRLPQTSCSTSSGRNKRPKGLSSVTIAKPLRKAANWRPIDSLSRKSAYKSTNSCRLLLLTIILAPSSCNSPAE